jgi:hypothetical protein
MNLTGGKRTLDKDSYTALGTVYRNNIVTIDTEPTVGEGFTWAEMCFL